MASLKQVLDIFDNPPSWVVRVPPSPRVGVPPTGGRPAGGGAVSSPQNCAPKGSVEGGLDYDRISARCIDDFPLFYEPLEAFDGDWGDRGWGCSAFDAKDFDVYPELRISSSGCRVKQRISSNCKFRGGGERGVVMGLSASSRSRFVEKLSEIDFSSITSSKHCYLKTAFFYTLTYSDKWSKNPLDWKKDLVSFFKRVQYVFPSVGFVWRLEFQKRGAPHFHVVAHLGGAKCSVSFMRQFIKKSWAGVISKNESKADDVRGLYGVGLAVAVYVSKYCGKNDSQNLRVPSGRCWGFWGRKFPAQRVQTWFVTLSDFRIFVRRVRRFCKKTSPFLRRVRENFRGRLYLPPEILYKLLSGLELRGVSA